MGASWKLQKPNLPTRNLVVSTRKLESTAYEAIATGQRSSPFGDQPDGYIGYS
jgi:hypothetical protein